MRFGAYIMVLLVVQITGAIAVEDQLRGFPRERTPEGLLIPRPAAELQQWAREAAGRGLNCPSPQALFDEGEGAQGAIWRLNCRSRDGQKSWDLKIVWRPGQGALLAPW